MRKVILSGLLLLLAASFYGQPTTPAPASPKEEYLRKSSSQKAGAWLLIGAGLVITAITAQNATSNIMEPTDNTGLYLAGAGVCGSAVLFAAAARNKRKARAAAITPALQMDRVPAPAATGMSIRNYPALGLTVQL